MADRFPSLEEFDEGQTEPKGETGNFDISSGPDDFLSRERAALGDDANQFATPNDGVPNAAMVEDADDDDLLGGGGGGGGAGPEISGFESSFPAIDTTNEAMAPGGTITGPTATLPYLPGHNQLPSMQAPVSSYPPSNYEPEDEPQVIREWRERRDLALQHRDEASAARKQETIKAAQSAIDDFYENYNNKKEKQVTQTRREAEEFLNSREDTSSGGTSWERIAKLVDLSGKGAKGGMHGSGKERFRELLLSLRKDEKAPGSTGY